MLLPWSIEAGEILLVHPQGRTYQHIANHIRAALREIPHAPKVHLALVQGNVEVDLADYDQDDLIIGLGFKSARWLNDQAPKASILYGLISRESYSTLSSRPRDSAVYVQQPRSRFAALVKAILPNARTGVILMPKDQPLPRRVRFGALSLVYRAIDSNNLASAELAPIMRQSDALIALSDWRIYNRHSIQSILLTSYRVRRPVFGYSESFVRAGAIAGIHSSPDQIAQQIARHTRHWLDRDELPPASHAEAYSISLNRNVARALEIPLPSVARIRQQIDQVELNKP